MLETYGCWPKEEKSKTSEIVASPTDLAKKYDDERNFFPEAGPSRVLDHTSKFTLDSEYSPNSQNSLANDLMKVSAFY